VQIDFVLEEGPGGQGVSNTDRVPDDQDMGQSLDLLNRSHRVYALGLFLCQCHK